MTGMATATDLVAVALPPGWAASQEAVGNASAVASAVASSVAVAVAVARDFALRLLTSPAVERAEHHSGPRGEEAHVSERSELCAVPLAREARRGPAGAARRIASRPVFLWATFLCTSKERWLAPRRGAKALDPASAAAWVFALERSNSQSAKQPRHEAELSPLLLRSELLLFARAKRSNQEKARPCLCAQPATRAGSTPPPGFFDETSLSRRKTTCIPARRPSRGLIRRLRRCGREPVKSKAGATVKAQAATSIFPALLVSRCKILQPLPNPFRVTPSQPTARPCHPW